MKLPLWVMILMFFLGLYIMFYWGYALYNYFNPAYIVKGDMIHHKKYGAYPKSVEFKQGMNIYPGQTATGTIEVSIGPEKK